MQKLFSVQYGSRLYGTQTPTSDLDLKHVYLPELKNMLLGKQLANKVKKTNTEKNVRNGAEDVDEEFLPLQVFARDFMMGQTYALELAFSVEGTHAGQTVHNPLFLEFVKELREKFLTSNVKALMGYAVNQASLYSFKGERLNVSREVLKLLKEFALVDEQERLSLFAMDARFEHLATKYPKYFRKTEYDVGGGVMRPCFVLLEKTLPFTNDVRMSVNVVNALVSKYGSRADAATADNVDWKATMHALRVVSEGVKLLTTGKMEFPFDQEYVNYLLSVKRGEVPLEEVTAQLTSQLDKLKEEEQKQALLPAYSQEMGHQFDEWLTGWLFKFYNL